MKSIDYIGVDIAPMKEVEGEYVNSLALAYIGDSVYSNAVRHYLLNRTGFKVGKLNTFANKIVNASAQHLVFKALLPELTEIEQGVVRRARNSDAGHKAKNYSVEDYKYATALEALIGFLYLTGAKERLDYIIKKALEIVVKDMEIV
ncbi:MAG: ribonuclease III domain-containing protein [Clostridia bacterium]